MLALGYGFCEDITAMQLSGVLEVLELKGLFNSPLEVVNLPRLKVLKLGSHFKQKVPALPVKKVSLPQWYKHNKHLVDKSLKISIRDAEKLD